MSSRAQDALTEEQLEAMLSEIGTRSPSGKRNLALLTLMADTGMRVGEALALSTRDLVSEAGQLTEVKLRQRKAHEEGCNLPLTRRAAVRLAAWLETRAKLGIGNGALFCTISRGQVSHPVEVEGGFGEELTTTELTPGKPLQDRYVREMVGRLAERAGIEQRVTPHTLRHTFATHMLRDGANLEMVRKWLGHASVEITARVYSHVSSNDMREAVERLRDRDD